MEWIEPVENKSEVIQQIKTYNLVIDFNDITDRHTNSIIIVVKCEHKT